MKEEMEQRLIESMDKVAEWVETAEGFAVEQAPLVVEEIICWGIVSSGIRAAGFAFASLVLTYIAWRLFRAGRHEASFGTDDPFGWYFVSGFAGVLSGFAIMGVVANLYMMAYPIVAPRLYVLDQLHQFIN